MQLISAYPIVQGYKYTAGVGMRAEFADRLRLVGVNVDASFSPDPNLPSDERAHVSFDAHLWDWKLTGYYNYADFYDLFGPTKVSRKGESLQAGAFAISDLRYAAHAFARMERGRLFGSRPRCLNIKTSPPTFAISCEANVMLKYSNLERAQGAVDDEKGTAWGLYSRLYYSHTAPSPGSGEITIADSCCRATAPSGCAPRPENRSAISTARFRASTSARSATIMSITAPSDRYRDYYSFPGVGIDAIGARSFGKLLGEYNLPPLRFRRGRDHLGLCELGAADVLFVRPGHELHQHPGGRDYFANLGTQLNFRLVLFTYLELDAFRRLRRRGRSQRPHHHRVHGLATDSLMLSPAVRLFLAQVSLSAFPGAALSVRAGVNRYLQAADALPRAAIGGRRLRSSGVLLGPQHRDLRFGRDRSCHMGAIRRSGD